MSVINRFINLFGPIFKVDEPFDIRFQRIHDRVYEDLKNDGKGFVIRCTFINVLKVYYSAVLFYSVLV